MVQKEINREPFEDCWRYFSTSLTYKDFQFISNITGIKYAVRNHTIGTLMRNINNGNIKGTFQWYYKGGASYKQTISEMANCGECKHRIKCALNQL